MSSTNPYFAAYDGFTRKYDCRLAYLRVSAGEALFLVLRADGTWAVIAPSEVPPGTRLGAVRVPYHRGVTLLGGWTPSGDALLAVPAPEVAFRRFPGGRAQEGFRRAKKHLQLALCELLASRPD